MKDIKISPIGAVDMLNFKNLGNKRKSMIKSGSSSYLPEEYNTNKVAKELHPGSIKVKVKEIIPESKNVKTIVLEPLIGKLPNFRAGQFITVTCNIGDSIATRTYSLSSSPKIGREGEYRITVKAKPRGFVSNYINNDLRVGEELTISEPSGTFYHTPLRDQKRMIGIAGGVGVSPFYSMAQAILDGEEDFELTLFYAAKKENDLVFKEQLDDIVCKTNKVKVIYVLSEEENERYESGYVKLSQIKPELYEAVSFFMAGPKPMIEYLSEELKPLKLPKKFFRYEDVSNKAKDNKYKLFKLTVATPDEILIIPCQSNETILTALEKEGIKSPSKCHVGTCGFCRSKLVYGNVMMIGDKRRISDIDNKYIHPCCSYPTEDCKIELI